MMIWRLRGGGTGLDVGNVVGQEMVGETGERDILYSHRQVLHTVGHRLLIASLVTNLMTNLMSSLVAVVSDAGHPEVLDLLGIEPGTLGDDVPVLVVLVVILLSEGREHI